MMATWQRSGRVGRARPRVAHRPGRAARRARPVPARPSGGAARRGPASGWSSIPANEPVARAHLRLRRGRDAARSGERDAALPRALRAGGRRAAARRASCVEAPTASALRSRRGAGRSATSSLRGSGRDLRDPRGRGSGAHDRHGRRRARATRVPPGRGLPARRPAVPGARARSRGARGVLAEPPSVDYFTSPLTEKETEILRGARASARRPARAPARPAAGHRAGGRLRAQAHRRRRRCSTQQPLDLPPVALRDRRALVGARRARVEETLRARPASTSWARSTPPSTRRSRSSRCSRSATAATSAASRYSLPPAGRRGAVSSSTTATRAASASRRAASRELPELLGRVRDLARRLRLRGRLPVLRAVAQVRQRQPAARQGGRPRARARAPLPREGATSSTPAGPLPPAPESGATTPRTSTSFLLEATTKAHTDMRANGSARRSEKRKASTEGGGGCGRRA